MSASAEGGCNTVNGSIDAFDTIVCAEAPGSGNGEAGSAQGAGSGDTGVTFSYVPYCERGDGITGGDFYGCGGQSACGEDGQAFVVYAVYPDGTTNSLGVQCIEPSAVPEAAAPPQVTPGMVAAAFRRVPLPESTLTLAPPGGRTLVGLDTVLWTQAERFSEVVTLLGQRVELDISPSSYSWSHGDGTGQETSSPGMAYAEGRPFADYVTHAYTRVSDAVSLSVDTTWSARFRVGGGPWQEVGETVTIEGDPVSLEVVEAEPNLVGY
ncbi:hypothetical protein [Nocardioides perillae]|uniref:PKD domain-containing protein n=1 Tax=Nocardioides perillae TaxID=1119534 RepID=A0A7Y9RUG8_9ACTN|nr:hypothetical protein [Nocardioides perillae]NYG54782.1 hypothetical protein [Nocardioides perillae]